MKSKIFFYRCLFFIFFYIHKFQINKIYCGKTEIINNKTSYELEIKNNLNQNIQDQKIILEKIKNLIKNQENKIDSIKTKINESLFYNNTSHKSFINKTQENISEEKKQLKKFNSNFCNLFTKECINIIDIEDNFFNHINPLKKTTDNLLIQNDVFNVINIFDILNNTYNKNFTEAEHIVDFLTINMNYLISRNPALFTNLNFKNNKKNSNNIHDSTLFILVFTNKSILILNNNYKIIEIFPLVMKSSIIKADLSFFEDDTSIILITEDSDVISLIVELDIISLAFNLNLIESKNNSGQLLNVKFFYINKKYFNLKTYKYFRFKKILFSSH